MQDQEKTIQHLERENITLKALVDQLEHGSNFYESNDQFDDTDPSSS